MSEAKWNDVQLFDQTHVDVACISMHDDGDSMFAMHNRVIDTNFDGGRRG